MEALAAPQEAPLQKTSNTPSGLPGSTVSARVAEARFPTLLVAVTAIV